MSAARPPHIRATTSRSGPRSRRWRWALWGLVVAVVLLGVVGAAGAVVYATVSLPSELELQPAVVVDRDGREIGTIEPEPGRRAVQLDEVPEAVRDAVVAAEDGSFYDHGGVSITGVLRALATNVVSGEVAQGGSTITQQYIKVLTTDTEQTLARKVREAALAMKLERRLSKDEILQRYLNNAYFGRGAYGIEAAASAYFDKRAAALTPAEGALLAGMLPAPSRLDPAVDPQRARERYDYTVERLDELGWADAGAYPSRPPSTVAPRSLQIGAAPYFLDEVRAEAAQHLGGEEAIFTGGATIHSTLDLDMQRAARRAERDVLREIDDARGAIVALDPEGGQVRAMVGGRDHTEEPLNLATRAVRQPGSTFKPLGLAAWLADGRSPETRLRAPAAWRRPGCVGTTEACTVRNYGRAGYGTLTVREATWRSVNTVYAQMGHELGTRRVVDMAEAAGIPDDRLDPSVEAVLGAQEVTPLELAVAYNTFASGGVHHPARTVERIERDGRLLWRADDRGERAMSQAVAANVSDVLQGVVTRGTGRAAAIGRPVAGKTGTTSRYADAWFAGYTPDLTATVWLGRPDSNEPMPGNPTGGSLPARAWAQFAGDALASVPPTPFPDAPRIGEPTAPTPTVEPGPATPVSPARPSPTAPRPSSPARPTGPTPTDRPSPPASGQPTGPGAPDPGGGTGGDGTGRLTPRAPATPAGDGSDQSPSSSSASSS